MRIRDWSSDGCSSDLIHTHYDGQVTWANRLDPSSRLGVTSVVMGNCGVGFAPCRPTDHDTLVRLLEGVEDIPEGVLTEGLSWNRSEERRVGETCVRTGRRQMSPSE